uniref:T-cell immunomodulatory protein TIP C2 domain-containing protein n=1 Tax=Megaselia scalaris TaxID=36166 RepID=T1GPQ4_MEGSC
MKFPFYCAFLAFSSSVVSSINITNLSFGAYSGVTAAFGDFNSDELTDIFMITNNSQTLQVLFASLTEPLLREGPKCHFDRHKITSVVPGDFDGDALMDVMVTLSEHSDSDKLKVFVNWGGSDYINCSNVHEKPLLETIGEPMALDYDRNMIIDLFGLNADGIDNYSSESRTFWVFQKDRSSPLPLKMSTAGSHIKKLRIPHSNAYLDLNNDNCADLYLHTEDGVEVWYGKTEQNEGFKFGHDTFPVISGATPIFGQTIFIDLDLTGKQVSIIPICFKSDCSNSTILIPHEKNDANVDWGFIPPNKKDQYFTNTIAVRAGDYNMDGYPDLLATLKQINNPQIIKTVLLENVPCTTCKLDQYKRTFKVNWNAFGSMGNNTVAGIFYDFYNDGILDIIFIEKNGDTFKPLAFKNDLDYDSNFVKCIVLTGLENSRNSTEKGHFGKKKRHYGTNLPGPKIEYLTTTIEGNDQRGISSQIPQSSYLALQLPYSVFGLGRTPNFVESFTVGISNRTRTWTQIIPNSQMIVIPKQLDVPSTWKAQLFVTPGKLILKSLMALSGTCVLIMIVILLLYLKERREDRLERINGNNRFHYAM